MKKKISIIMALIILFCFPFSTHAQEPNRAITEQIPLEASKFALAKYQEIIRASYGYYETLASDNPNDYSLGKPYVIYNYDEDIWQEIYYYPIYYKTETVLIISVIGTENGWIISASDEMVEYLNSITNFQHGNWLFYIQNGDLYHQNVETNRHRTNAIAQKMNKMQPLEYSKIKKPDFRYKKMGYTPSFSTSTSTSKVCSLYNKQLQLGYPICWAATTATLVNYRNGTSYSALDICDNLGVSYVSATIDETLNAINSYNLAYSISDNQLSWSKVKTNINNKYPIVVSAEHMMIDLHAVLVYGYRTINTSDYIILWNPGTGSTQTVYYSPNGSTFTYKNMTWTWTSSIAKYV